MAKETFPEKFQITRAQAIALWGAIHDLMLVTPWYQSCENCGEIYVGSSNPRFCGLCAAAKRRAVGAPDVRIVTTTGTGPFIDPKYDRQHHDQCGGCSLCLTTF